MWGSQADLVVKIPEGGSSEDISVRFEYSPHLAGTWFPIIDSFKGHTDATGVDSKAPFFVHWDMTGIEPGEYDVRAVGIHQIHGPDPHPNTILVTNALTPTAAAHYGDSDGQGQHFVEDDVQDSEPNDVHVGTVEDNTTTFLNLPSGALNENTRIRVKINRIDLHADKLNPDGGIPEYKGVELREFLLTNGQSVLNGKYGLVAIEYPDEDQNGYVDGTAVKEGDLKFYAWDVLQGLWKEEAYTFVDPDANMMLTITGHFSLFGIIKEEGLVNDDGWLQATAMENTPETPPEEAKTSAGMEMYGDAINGGIAGLAGSNAGLTHMILGHYDSSTRWYTGLALANPNEDFACEATLKAWGNDGKWKATYREEIPPKGKMQGTIATLFSNLTGTGWIDVTSNKPLVGLEVYGDKVAGGVASLPGGEPSSELHISHYDSGKSWWTGISLTNPNNRIANVNLTAYDNLGNTKAVKSLTVNPRCKTSGVVSTWLGITKGTGSIKIKSDQPLFGVCVFGQQPGTVAKPDIAALVAQTPMTAAKFPSYLNGSGWQSSIAVVNPGDSDIVVTMTAYGWDGTLIEAKDVNLGPRQKMAGMVDNLFTLAGYGRGSVTLASEDPFCAFELFILDDGANSGIAGIEPSIPGEEVTLAHYASNAQWWTYFALWNPSGTVSKGVFEAYAESGECQEGVFLDQDGKANYGAFLSDTFKTVGTSKKTSLYPGFESQPVRVHVEEFMKNVDLENFGAANLKVLSGGR